MRHSQKWNICPLTVSCFIIVRADFNCSDTAHRCDIIDNQGGKVIGSKVPKKPCLKAKRESAFLWSCDAAWERHRGILARPRMPKNWTARAIINRRPAKQAKKRVLSKGTRTPLMPAPHPRLRARQPGISAYAMRKHLCMQ